MGIQTLATVVIILWSMASTYVLLFLIDLICPIRMAEHMELLGADYCEHLVFHPGCGVTRAVSVLQHVPKFQGKVDTSLRHVGNNRGHDLYLQDIQKARRISPMADNPLRKVIIRMAESISQKLGFLAKRSLEKKDDSIEMKKKNDDIESAEY